MLIVQVHVHVGKESIEEFKQASMENARNSVKEDGIFRFDVIQNNEDPTRFMLNEVYKSLDATVDHKETEHYKKWWNAVEDLMVEPRYSIKYTNIFPTEEEDW